MAILWSDALSVGVDQIDDQHKTLIDRANQLFEAGKNGKSKEMIGEMLDFLDHYTVSHFRDEEKYMASINYPELETQKQHHADFIQKLQDLKKQYQTSGGNILVIINANQLIINWLTNHITMQDKKIGKFARSL